MRDLQQIQINFDTHRWPEQEHFPLNLAAHKRTVQSIVYEDISQSEEYLILTGFTSLSNLIDFFGSQEFEMLKKVRILIGFEPNMRGRKKYPIVKLDKEIKEYWIKKGLSVMLGGAVMNLIEKINRKEIQFKFKDRLHAKLFVGDNYAVLGSSNFSKNGLNDQDEANIRVCKNDDHEQKQYNDIKLIGESYWEDSVDYNQKIIELLQNLIQQVTWEEALARAISEILEGEWLESYREILEKLQNAKLWPTQWKGLAQAMTILQSQSNVLIADPTGAGKTKMCTSLVLSLQHWLFESGRSHHTSALAICPPLVVGKWKEEFRSQNRICEVESMGILSNSGEAKRKEIIGNLEIAKILTIDEAHNYLSPHSNRTETIKKNQADFKILVTATPISKRLEDLLQLIELLDVDNLSDDHFIDYCNLVLKRNKRSDQHIDQLRNFISKFTVRRTKRALNIEIEKEPESYRNRLDKVCKFPKQIEKTYTTKETFEDKKIVDQINDLASGIKGVTHLIKFNKPDFDISKEESKKSYIDNRISAGKALCVYQIRAALRSSHVALVEHIEGTKSAQEHFKFSGKSNTSGDKIAAIQKIISKNQLPYKSSIFKSEFFPYWLTNLDQYIEAVENDLRIYQKIAALAKQLSGEREKGKLDELVRIHKKHSFVLAFDSTVITLYYLRKLFSELYPDRKLLIATGSEKDKESERVMQVFSLTSESKDGMIALCSDKMSESVDLQKASTVVLLDLPSVLRIVEQRIGRADRMDSLHKEIEIYWPNDSHEYSLKADKRIVDTNAIVDKIYGANINIPEELKDKHFEKIDSIDNIIDEYKQFEDKDESWSGFNDSFQAVVELKEGKNTLITTDFYNQFKEVRSSIRTRVSFVGSETNWCFIALKGDQERSPRWYFIDHENNIHTDLPDICQQLRYHTSRKSVQLNWQQQSLQTYINHFKRMERDLLPPKKKRALEVAHAILLRQKNRKDYSSEEKESIQRLLDLFAKTPDFIIDYEHFADDWILLLQPLLNEKRANQGRKKKILNLSSLENDRKISFHIIDLIRILKNTRITEDIDSKIASCIIGIQSSESNNSLI